jgi:hypothetical protein
MKIVIKNYTLPQKAQLAAGIINIVRDTTLPIIEKAYYHYPVLPCLYEAALKLGRDSEIVEAARLEEVELLAGKDSKIQEGINRKKPFPAKTELSPADKLTISYNTAVKMLPIWASLDSTVALLQKCCDFLKARASKMTTADEALESLKANHFQLTVFKEEDFGGFQIRPISNATLDFNATSINTAGIERLLKEIQTFQLSESQLVVLYDNFDKLVASLANTEAAAGPAQEAVLLASADDEAEDDADDLPFKSISLAHDHAQEAAHEEGHLLDALGRALLDID